MAMYRSSPPFEPEKCLPVVTVAIRAYDREASIIEGSALLDDNITRQWRQRAGPGQSLYLASPSNGSLAYFSPSAGNLLRRATMSFCKA